MNSVPQLPSLLDSVPQLPMEPLSTRIDDAKAFLKENPDEKIAHVADKFCLHHTTLYSSIAHDKKPVSNIKKGGQNKILDEDQVGAVHKFIRSLLAYGIQPTHDVVYNAIVNLKRVQDPEKKSPTQRWFRGWWKTSNLHKIKTKPLAFVRFTAAQEKDVKTWFVDYRNVLKELEIKSKKDIINFDEAGFRVGCMKGRDIIVPADVLQVIILI